MINNNIIDVRHLDLVDLKMLVAIKKGNHRISYLQFPCDPPQKDGGIGPNRCLGICLKVHDAANQLLLCNIINVIIVRQFGLSVDLKVLVYSDNKAGNDRISNLQMLLIQFVHYMHQTLECVFAHLGVTAESRQ